MGKTGLTAFSDHLFTYERKIHHLDRLVSLSRQRHDEKVYIGMFESVLTTNLFYFLGYRGDNHEMFNISSELNQ